MKLLNDEAGESPDSALEKGAVPEADVDAGIAVSPDACTTGSAPASRTDLPPVIGLEQPVRKRESKNTVTKNAS